MPATRNSAWSKRPALQLWMPARFEQACAQEGQIATCDTVEVQVPDCQNFDPEHPETSKATLTPGGEDRGDEPVCFVASTATASSDFTAAPALPTATPTPMAAGLFGQRSTCVLDHAQSKATVTLDGEVTRNPPSAASWSSWGRPALGPRAPSA